MCADFRLLLWSVHPPVDKKIPGVFHPLARRPFLRSADSHVRQVQYRLKTERTWLVRAPDIALKFQVPTADLRAGGKPPWTRMERLQLIQPCGTPLGTCAQFA